MTEARVAELRKVVRGSALLDAVSFTVQPADACSDTSHPPSDGVHYSKAVYQLLCQMFANGFERLHEASPSATPVYEPKPTGVMGHAVLGAVVVTAVVIMLVTMDNFGG